MSQGILAADQTANRFIRQHYVKGQKNINPHFEFFRSFPTKSLYRRILTIIQPKSFIQSIQETRFHARFMSRKNYSPQEGTLRCYVRKSFCLDA